MIYRSTRGAEGDRSASYVIMHGIANDGGLYFPEKFPELSLERIKELTEDDYITRAAKILSMYLTDYTYEELLDAANKAYKPESFGDDPVPVVRKGGLDIIELWHGPTSAFKDMALQIMPHLLGMAIEKSGDARDALILVATSGDTGKAALEGYANVDRVKIIVFYPSQGVSEIQKLQMATQRGNNVCVTAVKGNFDDCQNGVKAIFGNSDAAAEANDHGLFFSSANSINFGRLAPQIVYYVSAYCDMVKKGRIKLGDRVNITVPTGNFGNILAAYMAKKMGLPVNKLICASNVNNVLTDFFRTGKYDRQREFHTTISPSMDILISSNLERLIYLCVGAEKCKEYMTSLKETGSFTVDDDVRKQLEHDFAAYYCNEDQTKDTIDAMFKASGYLIDPHTAVGVFAAHEYRKTDADTPMLVASTASPYKFSAAVLSALGKEVPENGFDAIAMLEKISGTTAPERLSKLREMLVRFTDTVEAEEMIDAVRKFAY